MFNVALLKDTVQVFPEKWKRSLDDSLTEEINKKYSNKVVPSLGLCICLYDIVESEEQYLYSGHSSFFVKVTFRVVVFRPFMNEVILGKVRVCTKEGVQVSLGFFDDIFVPSDCLQKQSFFDTDEQLWYWQYDDGEEVHKMYMDINQPLRFRVINEVFNDVAPTITSNESSVASSSSSTDGDALEAFKKSPYVVTGTIVDQGLGLTSWWGS